MTKYYKKFFLLSFFVIVTGCSSLGALKFWEDEEEDEIRPAELLSFNETFQTEILWSKNTGSELSYGRLLPDVYEEKVYFISSEGELNVFNLNGIKLFEKQTNDIVSGALTVNFSTILYGTLDGEIVALDSDSGNQIWRSQTSSEILVPPVTNGTVAVVQSADGKLSAFNLRDGSKLWVHQTQVPTLTLRGTSIPFIEQGFLFTGFSNGRIAMIYPESGAVRLEIPISINEGASELERIQDVDSKPLVLQNYLIGASYQGNIVSIDLLEGKVSWKQEISTIKDLTTDNIRIIAANADDEILAFGLSTGAILWQQEGLKYRQISSPIHFEGKVIVGDLEGYVHILDSQDGEFIGRKKISRQPIREVFLKGKEIFILDNSGKIFKVSPQPK
tara:strand:- start:18295 stop:19461 length:1167 start_codon:yes stop_codon:yes gene_type:complete